MDNNVQQKNICEETSQRLLSIYPDIIIARRKALLLLEKITGKSRTKLLATRFLVLTTGEHQELTRLLEMVTVHHLPLQYALGSMPFLNVELDIRPPILIPRPETEAWCALLIHKLRPLVPHIPHFAILDICSGSGCVALALAQAFPMATVLGLDISPLAIQLAEHNTQKNRIKNCQFLCSDLYTALPKHKTFDLIVTNPPYIAPEDFAHLDAEIRWWEDRQALVAENRGFALIEKIVTHAPHYLRNSHLGALWCEIGATQASTTSEFFTRSGFGTITVIKDLSGHDRVVVGAL